MKIKYRRQNACAGKQEKGCNIMLYVLFFLFFTAIFALVWKTKSDTKYTMNSIADTGVNKDINNHRPSDEYTALNPQKKQGSHLNRSDWELLLVNRWNKLPDDYDVDIKRISGGHGIDVRAYSDLQRMMDDIRAAGLDPVICSSYRTSQKQRRLFEQQIAKFLAQGFSREDAYNEASSWVAVPRTSEHETGLALDIVARSYQMLDKNQENTPEQRWLMENSYKYGFILRYPIDKSQITGIEYEPWHYRYVGKEAAEEIHKRGICLEEYLQGS